MHVVERDHDRPAGGEPLQHGTKRVVEAVAVSLAARADVSSANPDSDGNTWASSCRV